MLKQLEVKEHLRAKQQGLGRPIISTEHAGGRFVAVRDKLFFSKNWKFFPDFLSDFLKDELSGEWGNAEIKKPLQERHPLMQWYDAYCRFQRSHEKQSDGTYHGEPTGIYYCFMGLAYNLFLLRHNNEDVQKRLFERLKHPDQFQSAYHELMVANWLIRAGFELELEDEDSRKSRHCEFSATSIRTGKKYSVEAKMRGVKGLLGKTVGKDGDPTAHLIKHVNDALKKPAEGERLIFVDLNVEPMTREEFSLRDSTPPKWMETSEAKLRRLDRRLAGKKRAYVFVTNMAFHRALDETFQGHAAVTYGLGIPDYATPKEYRLKEAWKIKQKHIDMEYISETLTTYPKIPNHFEADMPPEKEGAPARIKIGNWYEFEDAGVRARVTSAQVIEDEKKIYMGVQTEDGRALILTEPMSDYEYDVYRQYPETYFGMVQEVPKRTDDPFEFYQRLVEIHRTYSREYFLRQMQDAPAIITLT